MSEKHYYSIVAIDDHPLFRKGVADLIDMEDSLSLVGEAANGADGMELIERLQPDLILLDINMKGMDGLETLQAIKRLELESRVLMLTVSNNEEDVVAAFKLGADGYLLKDMEPEDILDCLRKAAEGKVVMHESLTQLLAQAVRGEAGRPAADPTPSLTSREREILEKLAHGMSNKSIAAELEISEGTVKVHVKNLLKKLNLHSRMQAAVWALKGVRDRP
jgi:two-component system nitrate/nitrite response regulator NarL